MTTRPRRRPVSTRPPTAVGRDVDTAQRRPYHGPMDVGARAVECAVAGDAAQLESLLRSASARLRADLVVDARLRRSLDEPVGAVLGQGRTMGCASVLGQLGPSKIGTSALQTLDGD